MSIRIPKHYILGLRDVKKIRKTVTYKVLIAALNIGSAEDPLQPEKISLKVQDAASYLGDDPTKIYNYAVDIREDLITAFKDEIKAVTYNNGTFNILFRTAPEKESPKDIMIENDLMPKLRTIYSIALYETIKAQSHKELSPVINIRRDDLPEEGGPTIRAFVDPIKKAVEQINENSEFEVRRERVEDKYVIYCKLK